jgi:choline dehydrogenase-like flavoprotein
VRITEARHPLDLKATRFLVDRGMEVLRALPADEATAESTSGVTRFLQGGTCRFGDDPATSVLDRHCKVHEVDNLYVVDTSVFPSIGAVNPALTAMANSLRVGDHLTARLA